MQLNFNKFYPLSPDPTPLSKTKRKIVIPPEVGENLRPPKAQ